MKSIVDIKDFLNDSKLLKARKSFFSLIDTDFNLAMDLFKKIILVVPELKDYLHENDFIVRIAPKKLIPTV